MRTKSDQQLSTLDQPSIEARCGLKVHGVFEDTLWFSGVGSGCRGQGTLSVSDALITVDGNIEIPVMVSLVIGNEQQMKRRINEALDSLGL